MQGVGPKVAVAILSGLPVGELVRAISGADVARLTQIRGVGRKIAERLAVELRDKIGALGIGGGGSWRSAPAAPSIVPPGRLGEVHGALMALGYKPVEFEGLLPRLDPTQPTPDLDQAGAGRPAEEVKDGPQAPRRRSGSGAPGGTAARRNAVIAW